jgi:hypothetical protein
MSKYCGAPFRLDGLLTNSELDFVLNLNFLLSVTFYFKTNGKKYTCTLMTQLVVFKNSQSLFPFTGGQYPVELQSH